MKRIARLLTIISLACTGLVFTAAPVLAQERTCFTADPSYHAGVRVVNSVNYDRAVADIAISTTDGHFSICDSTPTDFDDNGSHAYVAVQPGTSNPYYGDDNAIFQVGITKCASFGVAVCDGDTAGPRYFWAYGGCNGAVPVPRDLGAVSSPTAWHNYKVAEGTSSWYVYLNGVSTASIPKTHGDVSCWINGDNEAHYSGEKWDKGDSLGDASLWATGWMLRFKAMQYSLDGNDAFVNLNNSGCSYITDPVRDFCDVINSNQMWVYTDQP